MSTDTPDEDASTAPPRFYILSVKWSRGDCLVWWRPEAAGYTLSLDDAGTYDAKRADAICRPSGGDCVAIPVGEARKFAVPVVLDGNLRAMLDECRGTEGTP